MKKKRIVENPPAFWVGALLLSILPAICLAEADTRLSESLRKSLEAQGWQEYQAADGSVIYFQPAPQAKPIDPSAIADKPENKQLSEALEGRGWQAEWDTDGSLVLRPQVQTGTSKMASQPSVTESHTDLVPDLPGFEYWRIEKGDDGSMYFHPLAKPPGKEVIAKDQTVLGRCEGILYATDRVSLPVDQWPEANELAQQWLYVSGLQGMLVGKIRKVLGIYLVSLVGDTAPHELMHQLAIRASDGRVMLLE